MAKTFLSADDTFTVANNNSTIVGGNGSETIQINSGITGLKLDGNIEKVELNNLAAADVELRVNNSNQLEFVNDGNVVATATAGLNSAVDVAFSDGNATLTQTGGASYTLADPDDDTDSVTVDANNSQDGNAVGLGDETSSDDDGGGGAGQTFTLTTGVDQVADFTGGSGDDVFIADDTGDDVLSAADTLDGKGGDDTLRIFTDGAASAIPQISNIENIEVFDLDEAYDLSSMSDATSVTLQRGEGDDTVTVGAGVSAVTVNDIAIGTGGDNAALTIAHAATDTAADINVNEVTAAGDDANEDLALTGAAIETVTVNATGVASAFDALDVAAATAVTIDAAVDFTAPVETTGTDGTLTLKGAGAIDIGTLDAGIDTVDAAEHTGGLTLTLDGESDTSLTLGSGDDVITTDTAYVADDEASIDAGEGTDRLVVPTSAHITTAAGEKYSNFEELQVVDDQSVVVSDLATNNDISAIFLEADGDNTVGATELTAAQAQNVSIIDGGTAEGSVVTVGVADATTPGQDDTVGVTLDNDDGDIDVDNIVIDGVETLDVTVNTDTESVISALDHQDFDTLNIDGAGDLDLTTANVAANQNTTIDGSEATGDLTLDLQESTTNGMAIQGGSGDDTINGGEGDDVITGNGGDDTFLIADVATAIGSDTITDFTAGGSGDVISSLDVASADTTGANFDYSEEAIDGADVTATADDLEVVTDGSGSGNTADSLSDADVEAFLADVDGDGNGLIGNQTNADDFFVAVSDGTDTGIFLVDQDTNADAVEAGELNLLLTLQGIADPTELAAGDFTT